MILISVTFAETGHEYDFKADENAPVGQVTEEMVVMIAEEEQYVLGENRKSFFLCNPETAQIFSPESTLSINGVTSGTSLLLV